MSLLSSVTPPPPLACFTVMASLQVWGSRMKSPLCLRGFRAISISVLFLMQPCLPPCPLLLQEVHSLGHYEGGGEDGMWHVG